MMVDKLIELLESLEYEVYRQGSFSDTDEYPDSFFTYWNSETPDHDHYDNDNYGTEWGFDVNFYSTDPDKTYQVIEDVRILLKSSGWIVPSKGYDVTSDRPTHTGRGIYVQYLEVN